ncbi:ubiquitin-conjugating enzyme E2 G2 isoform X2 [Rissa tridactyla]|uniref:ubiquitin-conjugating enzyme E2 G2 isoform X2 n=1 Tax=Rissa tridactyla TaxID=75485 RepID=UPI0023BAC039|nr:ubiquitin-conjugating enzyme E2 G2 isoform X2 [Rissa tridactyla]
MAGTALKRLMAEYKQLTLNPPEGIVAGPMNEENFFEWEALIMGPEDTCFEYGVFPAILSFPLDYPLSPPKMRFTCEMFHPNTQIWSPEEQQHWKYWVPVVISWAPAELGHVAKAELHSRCVASSAFLWPHYQVSGVQPVKTTCDVAEALFNKFTRMEEFASLFFMLLGMIPWDMRAALSGGVPCRAWKRSSYQSLACWQSQMMKAEPM